MDDYGVLERWLPFPVKRGFILQCADLAMTIASVETKISLVSLLLKTQTVGSELAGPQVESRLLKKSSARESEVLF